jgi:hypothetical protein
VPGDCGEAGVASGGCGAAVAEQILDGTQVKPLLEQVGGVAMSPM